MSEYLSGAGPIEQFLATPRGKELLSEGQIVIDSAWDKEQRHISLELSNPERFSGDPTARSIRYDAYFKGDREMYLSEDRLVATYQNIPWINPSCTLQFHKLDENGQPIDKAIIGEPTFAMLDRGMAADRNDLVFSTNFGFMNKHLFQAIYSPKDKERENIKKGDLLVIVYSSPFGRSNLQEEDIRDSLISRKLVSPNGKKKISICSNVEVDFLYAHDGSGEGGVLRIEARDGSSEKAHFFALESIDVEEWLNKITGEGDDWRSLDTEFPTSFNIISQPF